jgi:hypothetical protein
MTYKEIARAIANSYTPPQPNGNESLVRYYRADGTTAVNTEEAQYMSRYNPLTKRLKVLLYPHHDLIGLFYLGDD